MPKLINLIGTRYGKLTIIARAENQGKKVRWLCECDCGNQSIVQSGHLKNGSIKSCGCVGAHGMSDSSTHRSWRSMRQRCTDRNHRSFRDYGGRGITICERWNSFENFLADMGERPNGMTLDRRDVDGPYDVSNCRWATAKEQQNNKRNNHLVEYAGEKKTISQWADDFGIKQNSLYYKLAYNAFVMEGALMTVNNFPSQ